MAPVLCLFLLSMDLYLMLQWVFSASYRFEEAGLPGSVVRQSLGCPTVGLDSVFSPFLSPSNHTQHPSHIKHKTQFSPVKMYRVPTTFNLTMGFLNLGPWIECRGSINLDGKIIPSLCLLTFNLATSNISFSKECRQQPRAHVSSPCRPVSRRNWMDSSHCEVRHVPQGPFSKTSKSW